MKDKEKTKAQLIAELEALRARVAKLESLEAEHKRVEEEKPKLLHDVQERVKELRGLYTIDTIANRKDITIEQIFKETTNLIPPSWQYPEITCSRITFEDKQFMTENFKKTKWCQSEDIVINGKKVGLIEVCYLEKKPDEYEGPFLKEERDFINSIAKRLSSITERKRVEEALRIKDSAIASSISAIGIADPEGNMTYINNSFLKLWAYNDDKEVLGKPIVKFWQTEEKVLKVIESLRDRGSWIGELVARRKDGSLFDTHLSASLVTDEAGKPICMMASFIDITKPKRMEEELKKHRRHLEELVEARTAELKNINEQLQREITERKRAENILQVSHHFLEIAYRHREMTPLLKEFVAEVQNLTGCAAAAIRILEEEGKIPYQAYEGFSQRFLESESALSIKSDKCWCINVIKGTGDPKFPFYTNGGSFYKNGTTRLLATIPEEEREQTRNACNECGYESVALVPIRFGDHILGLIHAADHRENMIPLDIVEMLEGTAKQLGTAIQKVRAEEELRISREQLRNLSTHLQSVREEERTRIAQVIHDECGQEMTALKMDISWLGKKLHKDQKSLLEKTKSMEKLIDMTIHRAQSMSAELRPGVLDDLGLVSAIEWQTEEFQNRAGIKCEVAIEPEDIILDQERSTTIFRILQETLTNVARHAKATRVKVSLKEQAGNLVLKVRDNGRGITEKQISDPKSFGLIGMRERAHYWGGEVKIIGVKNKGTTVIVSIPLNKKGESDDKNTHR